MANNTSEVGGTQFYSALQQKAMSAVQSVLNTQLYPVQYPAQGDFLWNWQNPNQVFNNGTYQYINALVTPGDIPNTVQLSPAGGFANAYVQVLNDIVFSLSKADQQTLTQAQNNASTQAGTIVKDYQASYGPITTAQMTQAGVSNKVDYVISFVMGSQWSGATPPISYTEMATARNLKALLPKAPMGADQIISDVTVYLNLMQPVNGLSNQLQNGAWTIRQLINNASSPSATNGGMQTMDPNTGSTLSGYNEGWAISYDTSSISNDLQNTSRTIEVSMQTSEASGNTLNVNVEGQAGFSIGSWLTFDVEGSASYDMSKVQGTSCDASVTIKYTGYSIVPMQPAAWQQATNVGFYYPNVIAQAVANSGQDVTGFKFLNASPYNLGSISSGGNFGVLTNLLIANYPTVTITYQKADFSSFEQSWSEKVSGNLTLFGFIKLGSFSQGAYGSSYAEGSDNSSFSVSFSASPQVVSVPQLLQTAYVIGGSVQNPGVTYGTSPDVGLLRHGVARMDAGAQTAMGKNPQY